MSILTALKYWWDTSNKSNRNINDLIYGKIKIYGNTFRIKPGGRKAHLNIVNSNMNILELGNPKTRKELYDTIRNRLDNIKQFYGARHTLRRRRRNKEKTRKKMRKSCSLSKHLKNES